ncbi:MAG TPA: beta-ketoacyl-ACP synthase II [Fimbriimonadaceae bacterium]|nr:beta-ketoacyl-ACP synthase II [Fimbriimonadaceae bacterium]
MPSKRRIAVTGIGPVTPVGIGIDPFWDSIRAGRSGAGHVTQFDTTGFAVNIAAEVKDFNIADFIEPRRSRRMELFTQFAFAASKMALEHAGLNPSDPDPVRVGVVIGSGVGGLRLIEDDTMNLNTKGPRSVAPDLIARMMANSASGAVAIEFGFQGPNEATVTACAASGNAMARAIDHIRNGNADIVVTGGTETPITPLGLAAFCAARALSKRNDDPEHASRPFDANRDGFLLAEGSTVLVFEAWDVAEARGANILAEVLGYGLSADAHHLVMPQPEGVGAAACMHMALADAQLTPGDVGYISAHGTATSLGDAAETKAIRKVFGDSPPPTSSTKSMTGHLLGAAGSTAAAATIMALVDQTLPPTTNYETPDPACDLDVVPNQARPAKLEAAIINTFGFGGHNATIAFGKA